MNSTHVIHTCNGDTFRYRIYETGSGSQKFGPCEICNEHVSSTYHQVEEFWIEGDDGGWTQFGCHNIFGHRECLASKRRGEIVKDGLLPMFKDVKVKSKKTIQAAKILLDEGIDPSLLGRENAFSLLFDLGYSWNSAKAVWRKSRHI